LRRALLQQLWQLGDIACDPLRLIAREQLCHDVRWRSHIGGEVAAGITAGITKVN
jgi:hypothetical protein